MEISLDLASVETLIDIRNERMIEFVFQDAATARVTAQLDMTDLNALATSDAMTVETCGSLTLLGTETELDARFFVMRLREDQGLVTTDGMVMLSTEGAGVDAGINMLQELAGLDGVSRVGPVSMRLIFDAAQ